MINAMTWLESLNCPVVRQVKHTKNIVEDYDFSTRQVGQVSSGKLISRSYEPRNSTLTPGLTRNGTGGTFFQISELINQGFEFTPNFGQNPHLQKFFFSTSHLPVVKQCAGQGGSEGHHRGHKKKP
jgi:hypothetical protein